MINKDEIEKYCELAESVGFRVLGALFFLMVAMAMLVIVTGLGRVLIQILYA